MANEITLAPKDMMLGETRDYRVRLQEEKDADLSGVTATLEILDSAGATVLAAQTMTLTGTRKPIVSYPITSGGGLNITAAGDYFVVVKVTRGGKPRIWQGLLRVKLKGP